jgi:hypothetical protein
LLCERSIQWLRLLEVPDVSSDPAGEIRRCVFKVLDRGRIENEHGGSASLEARPVQVCSKPIRISKCTYTNDNRNSIHVRYCKILQIST